jgi:hypothetical protein
MMIALYPSYPSRPNEPDPAFGWEVQWAKKAGFKISFIDLELQLGGDVILRKFPEGEHTVIYRGWLITPSDYLKLDTALALKGCKLLESYEAYREAYEFPMWYARIMDETPLSVSYTGTPELLPKRETFDLQAIAKDLQHHIKGAAIVKDFIKSRKQDWFDACFIPDVRDEEMVIKVVSRFLDLMEGTLYGGLVFRQFEDFKRIGTHPKTKMPVVNEWRGFMLNGKLIYKAPYWASGNYDEAKEPDASVFEGIVAKANFVSPFIALDVAERDDNDGTWRTIEINSGGASGVPEGGDVKDFYQALGKAIQS